MKYTFAGLSALALAVGFPVFAHAGVINLGTAASALSRNGFRVNRRGFALIWKSDNALVTPFSRPDRS
jgi:hypothetical protein